MKKKTMVLAAAGLMLVVGGLYASNMGFKLAYQLTTTTPANQNPIALPYNQQSGLNNASDLLQDIQNSSGATVSGISFYNNADGFTSYSLSGGADFALETGKAYLVQVTGPATYIVVGSHKPGFLVSLTTTTPANQNFYSYPYHSVAATASDLLTEIGSDASGVSFYNSADGFTSYSFSGGADFALKPGEGYLIQVTNPVSFIPAHY